jgi:sigma-B regulation protein RsbU (phosphoserine phosphatase)
MPTTAQESANWSELLRMAGSEASSRALIESLAAHFIESSGLTSIALYGEDEGRHRRILTVGPFAFPDCPTDPHAHGTHDLPGALMLFEPAAVSAAQFDSHSLLTLICALQAARLRRQVKRQSFAAKFRGVELQSLYDVGLAIARTLDLDRLGEEVLLRAVSLLDARVGALYLLDDGAFRLDRTFGGQAPEVVDLEDPGLLSLGDGTACRLAPLSGAEYQLCVPIEADDKRLGLLVVADKESRTGVGPFSEADRRMLGLFANQAAIALENARLHLQALEKERLERELDLAADIQRQLLPKHLPDVAGFEFAGWSRPARHVGGDYYDVRRVEDGGVHLVLGDVSGKGMPAALLVSTLHSAMRLLAGSRPFDGDLFASLNQHIVSSSASNKFITMTAAKLDPETGVVDYVNAGHNPPLLVRRAGAVEELPAGGLPLGIFASALYRVGRVELEAGDLLCIYSDGITECEAPAGEEFGDLRLKGLLREATGKPLTEVVEQLDRAVVGFAAGGPQGDDQTVVLLRRV